MHRSTDPSNPKGRHCLGKNSSSLADRMVLCQGSGKTTFAEECVARRGLVYIGADAIAAEMNPADPLRARISASREFLKRVSASISDSNSFVVESTLSGRTFRQIILDASSKGFEITIVYLFVDSVELCIDRVRERVLKGGHDVPEADIRRRFARSLRNFWQIYRTISTSWILIYNSGIEPQDVAVGTPSQMSIRDAELYRQFQQLMKSD